MRYLFFTFLVIFTVYMSFVQAVSFAPLEKVYQSSAALKTLAISHDGLKVAFSSTARDSKGDILVLDLKTKKRKLLTTSDALDSQPVWSLDDKEIFFFSNRDAKAGIYKIQLSSKKVERISPQGVWSEFPDLSKNGKKLLYYSKREGGYNLYELELANKTEKQLTTGSDFNFGPKYASKNKILFYSKRDGEFSIYELDRSTKKIKSMKGPGGFTFQPTAYLKNRIYFCVSNIKGANDVYMVTKSGKSEAVFPSSSQDMYPTYDKRNKRLFFISQREGDYAIYGTFLQK